MSRVSKTKQKKYSGIENSRYAREIHGLRSSGASGPHGDRRTRRARTRSSERSKAINYAS